MEKQISSWPRLLRHERELRGWSQERVARAININPKTVGRWERGEVKPSPEYRLLLCELYKKAPEELGLVSSEAENNLEDISQNVAIAPALSRPSINAHRVDWGEALRVRHLYGRDEECLDLKRWIVDDRSSVIALLGTGGIGKTALAAAIKEQVQDDFDFVFWRSLQNASPLDTILQKCILILSNEQQIDLPDDIEERISLFVEYLRKYRCLLVFDNLETLLQSEQEAGNWLDGYEGYGRLIKLLGEVDHQSCLLLTSREKPKEIAHAEGSSSPVRSLRITGLELAEAQKLLEDAELLGTEEAWKAFVYLYSGNPLALKLVSGTIREIFQGNITRFLKEGMAVFGDVYDLMAKQFRRLSAPEQEVLYWLAVEREQLSLDELREDIIRPLSKGTLLKALDSLQKRNMIETDVKGYFGLQPVIMEYVTDNLIEHICHEIKNEEPKLLIKHALMKAQVKDYIRDSQSLLILTPLVQRLLDTMNKEEIEEKCKNILTILRKMNIQRTGYAAGNLLNLLLHMQCDLRGYDFSHLQIRQAYLQNRSLAEINFAYADIVASTFTDTFGGVLSAAFSPDGQLLAAGTASCDIRIWQVADGTPLFTLKGHDHWVWSIAFSPDGRFLASASVDKTVRLWDIDAGTCLDTLEGHTNRVHSVAFSPDGLLLASGSSDQTIRIWDVKTRRNLHVLEGHSNWVWSVAFCPDGHMLASASGDQTIRFWDTRTGKCLDILEGHTGRIMSIAFSPDSRLLASGGEDRAIRLWDLATRRCLKALPGHTDRIWTINFAPDGYTLATGSDDMSIRLWDVRTGRCLTTLQGHTNWIRSVAFNPEGQLLASAGEDQTVRLWDVATEHCLSTFQGYINGVTSTAFSPDGHLVASGSEDRTVRLWSTDSDTCLRTFSGHTGWVWSVAFNPDPATHMLASGSNDQTIRLWNIYTGTALNILAGHTDWIWSVAFNHDGTLLASGSEDQTICLWDTQTGERLHVLRGHSNSVGAVVFNTDGSILASSSRDATIRLWDVKTGECLNILQDSWSVAFSPRKSVLASVDSAQGIHFLEMETKQSINILYGHTDLIRSITFNADGSLLASSGYDQTIRLWDVQSGASLHTLQGHTDWVRSVAFSPDGQFIISGSKDGTVKYWDVQSGTCLKTLRNLRIYENMNITGTTGLTQAQKEALKTLGAFEDKEEQLLELAYKR